LDQMPESLESGKGALDIFDKMAAADPQNEVVRERLASMLVGVGYLHWENKQMPEARRLSERGLALLAETANHPGAGPQALHDYAEALLWCQPEQLQNPALALQYAEKAVQRSRGENFVHIDLLAQALAATNNHARAVQVLEQALPKLPSGQKTHLRLV